MKQLIAITHEEILPNEARLIVTAMQSGIDRLHMRKPYADYHAVDTLLRAIPSTLHPHIVLHDHFTLAQSYAVGGIHLNSRHVEKPRDWQGSVSRSCHTFEEITRYKSTHDYLFLSPIYNSISKVGYSATFTHDALLQASLEGTIDHQVIALGGITLDNIATTMQHYNFGGVAVLGTLWQHLDEEQIKHTAKQLKDRILCYNSSHTAMNDMTTFRGQ